MQIFDVVEPYIPGPVGPIGPANELGVGDVQTLPVGSEATAEITGEYPDQKLNLGLPRGERGPKGDPGAGNVNSVNGKLGPDVTLAPGDVGATVAANPGSIPLRSTSGRVPGIGTPVIATDAANKSYVDAADSAAAEAISRLAKRADARSHIRYVHGSVFSYEVIRITGADGIKKVQPSGMLSNGRIARTARKPLKQLGSDFGHGRVVNADASVNVDATYAMVGGINITGGVAYHSFGDAPPLGTSGTELFDTEAIALHKDGSLKYIAKADGKTAAQYVADGFTDTFGHGPVLVRNGAITDWYTKSGYQEFVTKVSARTILGQAANGDFIIITVHGRTNSYGIAGKGMSDLALAEGCVIAVNLDGGGSTQGVWVGTTFHPSTDASYERPMMSAIAITAPHSDLFDTGSISLPLAPVASPAVTRFTKHAANAPALAVRVRDGVARLTCNMTSINDASGSPQAFPKNAWVLASASLVPEWMCPAFFAESRGTVASGAGQQVTASLTTDQRIYVRNNSTVDMLEVNGSMTWTTRDILGDTV